MGKRIDTIIRYANKSTSSLAFWWLPITEGSGNYELSKTKTGDYYLNFSEKAKYNTLFDEKGVILLDYKGKVGIQYNPCAIAQYGLGLYTRYKKYRNRDDLEKMEIQAQWLYENVKVGKNGIGRLEYTFGYDDYKQIETVNFISSIAQGQAISFLIRAAILLNKAKYLDVVDSLFESFKYHVQDGGVVNYDEEGRMYLEESPTPKISCILDGFMYAMFGVYDYYLFSKKGEALEIFRNCCRTLKERLPDFDLGFWSRADCYLDKPKMPASKFYHNVHIQQLKAMYTITGDKLFKDYYEKWEGYQKNFFCNQIAFVYKCWFKLFYY